MEWNVIVTVTERGYPEVRSLLQEYGHVEKSDFFNVLVMQVDDMEAFLEAMRRLYESLPPILTYIGRIIPVTHYFRYQTPAEFEERAREVVTQWLDGLAGSHFYVRMHRRGFKGRLSS